MSNGTCLCIADKDHMRRLLMDGISERKSTRDLLIAANKFLEEIGVTLHDSTIYNYIREAKESLELVYKKDRQRARVKAIGRLTALYKRCIAQGDNATALKIEKELALFQGIYKDLDTEDKEQTINIVFRDASKEDVEE